MKKPFDYKKEFVLYRKVLRKGKGSKNLGKYAKQYMWWKSFIYLKYKDLAESDVFRNLLKQELGNTKISIKNFERLTVPIEVVAISLMSAINENNNGKIEAIGTILFAVIYLTRIHTKELMKENFNEEIYRILYKK